LVGATPTEHVSESSAATRARIWRPISAGRPSRRWAPATSRKASSTESGSTNGVMSPKTRMTSPDASA
jgi:hypothetical protein